MSIYFSNAGVIDLDVIRIMGISAKTNENPIGYFGTGLKYAIAVLLRTGHTITLKAGEEKYAFNARETTIRGKAFSRVHMNDEALGFTTELGKNWEVWEAYRELHSNTLDECGTISDKPLRGDTVITVSGAGIEMEYHNRDKIFLDRKPIAANEFIEVYSGETSYLYYRGVRAGGAISGDMKFTYNILSNMKLTEDRKLESQWDVEYKLSSIIPTLHNKGLFVQLLEGSKTWDQSLSFDYCSSPSKEFLSAAADRASDIGLPNAARKILERDLQETGDFKEAVLSDMEHEKFLSSFAHLLNLGCTLGPEDVVVAETLGPDCMGLYHKNKNQVYLAKSTLDWGSETIVATLYEEWLHKEYKYKDMSRQLQNFLFQRLVSLTMGSDMPSPKLQ